MERLCFQMDDSGHWYLILDSDRERFHELLNGSEPEFFKVFGGCRTALPPSQYTFTEPRLRERGT